MVYMTGFVTVQITYLLTILNDPHVFVRSDDSLVRQDDFVLLSGPV